MWAYGWCECVQFSDAGRSLSLPSFYRGPIKRYRTRPPEINTNERNCVCAVCVWLPLKMRIALASKCLYDAFSTDNATGLSGVAPNVITHTHYRLLWQQYYEKLRLPPVGRWRYHVHTNRLQFISTFKRTQHREKSASCRRTNVGHIWRAAAAEINCVNLICSPTTSR